MVEEAPQTLHFLVGLCRLEGALQLLASSLRDAALAFSPLCLGSAPTLFFQAILSPLLGQMAERNASAFMGGIGLISAFVALFITNLLLNSLTIDGAVTWVAAVVVVWLFGAIAAFVLPFFVLKKAVDERRG